MRRCAELLLVFLHVTEICGLGQRSQSLLAAKREEKQRRKSATEQTNICVQCILEGRRSQAC